MDTQDLQNQITDLKKTVMDLQNQLSNLNRSSTFPRDTETAIIERLKTISSIGVTGATTTASGYVEITLSNGITYQILKV